MSSPINNVLRQAITTFTCKQELFYLNIQLLASLLEKVNAADVNYHPQFTTDWLWNQPGKAPVTCIDIYEDANLTMGIFILKPGGQLPLHNHPDMHGLIKVIAGKLKITSYSLNTGNTTEIDTRSFKDGINPTANFSHKNIITAELNSIDVVDTGSKPCILEPNLKNLHEIQSIDGPAAFIDILAPPYGTSNRNNDSRLCSYYSILSQVLPHKIFRLQEIKSPSWYWTDEFPYKGPRIKI